MTPAPLAFADGWRDGWSATGVDDGWTTVEVSGADAPRALAQATSADLAAGSPSAAIVFFGLRGLLTRRHAGFRLHVEAPWLKTLLAGLDGVWTGRARAGGRSTWAPGRGYSAYQLVQVATSLRAKRSNPGERRASDELPGLLRRSAPRNDVEGDIDQGRKRWRRRQ